MAFVTDLDCSLLAKKSEAKFGSLRLLYDLYKQRSIITRYGLSS